MKEVQLKITPPLVKMNGSGVGIEGGWDYDK